MKNSLLLGLLGVSVLANIAFVVRPWMTSTDSAMDSVAKFSGNQRSAAVSQKSVPAGAPAAESKNPVAGRSLNSDDDLRALVAELRSSGLPAKSIHAILAALLTEQMRASFAKVPFWQRMSPNKETTIAQQAAARAMQTKLEQILGADGRQSITMDAVTREQRYGAMSDEKLEAVLQLERDYQEIRTDTTKLGGFNPNEVRAHLAQLALLEKEKLSDLANILTPAELLAYELRNSETARRVMTAVRDINVTEDEYAALFQLQKTDDTMNPRPLGDTLTAEQYNKWRAAQVALQEKIRMVLPDDRFYKFLEGTDFVYGIVAGFARQNPSVTPATSYQVFQLQNETETALGSLSRQIRTAGENSPAAAELAKKLVAYNARLDALLGPDIAAAYRKQPLARIFTPPASPKPTPGGG